MLRVEQKDNKTKGNLAHYEFPVIDPPYSVCGPFWKHEDAKLLLSYDQIVWSVADEVLEIAKQVFNKEVTWYDITSEVFEKHLIKPLEQSGWEIEVHQPSLNTTSVYYALGRKI